LKLASNVSINRRRLEIIRKREKEQDKQDKAAIKNNDPIDEIWHNQHNENNLE
jgi:hypothetical protein